MSQDLIRLRVSVQRHGVPEVKLVWPCARSHDLTVSKFLSQINEVMPLEGSEWGLEDYVVELADGAGGSYECLHFQPVPHILKEDDRIVIRCLYGEDLQRRRLAGRHQISSSGRHLVDGLVFGKPWVRAPRDRPALELPPRKRARIHDDYGFDNQGLLAEAPQPQLLPESTQRHPSNKVSFQDTLTDGSDDSDEYQDEDSGDDSDQDECTDHGHNEDRDELVEELRQLRDDNKAVGRATPINDSENTRPSLQGIHSQMSTSNSLDLGALDGIVALRVAFPQTPIVFLEKELLRHQKDITKAYDALSVAYEPALTLHDTMTHALMSAFSGNLSAPVSGGGDVAHERSSISRPLIQVVESSNGPKDAVSGPLDGPLNNAEEQGLNDGIVDNVQSDTTTDEESNGDSDDTEITKYSEDSDDTSSEGSDSTSDDSSGSSDGSSSDDGDGESSDDDVGALVDAQDERSSGPSSDGSESDSDSSDDYQAPAGQQAAQDAHREISYDESSSDCSSESSSESSSDESESSSDSSDDGNEASASRQRAPDRSRERGQGDSETPIAPPAAPSAAPSGLTRTQKRNARRRRNMARAQAGHVTQAPTVSKDEASAFEQRKQQLLHSLDDGRDMPDDGQDAEAAQDHGTGQEQSGDTLRTATQGQRARLDVSAGRRLLFGSLGLKAPKTRADEERIKQVLMKNVRPLENARLKECNRVIEDGSAATADGTEDWRQSIVYCAVECDQRDMVLSEPPFPFEQRWDPQQRGANCRKRKRNSQAFSEDYGDDDSGLYLEEDSGRNKMARSAAAENEGPAFDGTASSEREGRNGEAHTDNIPQLPADLSSLADLEAGQAKEGMVITWKQMVMSKATRWQPTVVQVTGTVLAGSDPSSLCVLLAMRDREDRSKTYDEEGNRVYDKFEMPDADSGGEGEGEDEDDGERIVSWAEMTEPKIVRMPEEATEEAEATEEPAQP